MLAASSSMPALFCVLRTFPSQAVSLLSGMFVMSVIVFSFVCNYPFGLASDPPGAGAASHRKIGGDRIRGNRFFLLTREAPADGRGQECPKGEFSYSRRKLSAIATPWNDGE